MTLDLVFVVAGGLKISALGITESVTGAVVRA